MRLYISSEGSPTFKISDLIDNSSQHSFITNAINSSYQPSFSSSATINILCFADNSAQLSNKLNAPNFRFFVKLKILSFPIRKCFIKSPY